VLSVLTFETLDEAISIANAIDTVFPPACEP